MDKEIMVYSLNGKIFRNKNTTSHNGMNLKHKVKLNKPNTIEAIL